MATSSHTTESEQWNTLHGYVLMCIITQIDGAGEWGKQSKDH